MTHERIEQQLEAGNPQVPETRARKKRIRAALMWRFEMDRHDHETRARFGFFAKTMTYKRILPVGAVLALAIAYGFGAGFDWGGTAPRAEAEGMVKRAITRFKEITPELRAEIEARAKADMLASLEEANKAPDLTVLTPEQFKTEFTVEFEARAKEHYEYFASGTTAIKEEMGKQIGTFGPGKPFMIKTAVKYLRYTDPKGRITTLGVDEEGVPVMKIMKVTMPMGENGEMIGVTGIESGGLVKIKKLDPTELEALKLQGKEVFFEEMIKE